MQQANQLRRRVAGDRADLELSARLEADRRQSRRVEPRGSIVSAEFPPPRPGRVSTKPLDQATRPTERQRQSRQLVEHEEFNFGTDAIHRAVLWRETRRVDVV